MERYDPNSVRLFTLAQFSRLVKPAYRLSGVA
jgi:hypothetical protein